MTKPTGRPKGHPKKYESEDEKPVTFTVRIPRALAAAGKRYAAQHRQSVSELLLDGLRWRLTEGDPRGNGVDLPPADTETHNPYYENTEDPGAVLAELRALRTLFTETVASGALAAPTPHSRNTGIHTSAPTAVAPLDGQGTPQHAHSGAPRAPYGDVKARVLAAVEQHARAVSCHVIAIGLELPPKTVHQALQALVHAHEVVKSGAGKAAVYGLPRPRPARV